MQILLADDHRLFRDAMAEWLKQLDNNVCISHAGSLNETIRSIHQNRPYQLIILDLHMPGMDGITSIKHICQLAHPAATAIISADESPLTISACMQTNISGYIPKSSNGETVLKAIHCILQGDNYWPENISPDDSQWSDRQMQLLSCLARGIPNKEIAKELFLSEGTVKQYVSNILKAMQVDNRTQAGIKAREILGLTSN